jgi:hypothetical protein
MRRLPALAGATLRNWNLTVQTAREEAKARASADHVIDLRNPDAFALRPVGAVLLASRDPAGSPVRILLPTNKVFETCARLVLLRRDGSSAIPGQIVVKLPSVDVAESTPRVASVASALGLELPMAAPSAADSEAGGRRDSYVALVAARIRLASWLLAEVQVEHHANERRVVINVLFSCRLPEGETGIFGRGSGDALRG